MFNDGIACFFATMGSSSTPVLLRHHMWAAYEKSASQQSNTLLPQSGFEPTTISFQAGRVQIYCTLVVIIYKCMQLQYSTVEPHYGCHSVQWNLGMAVTLYRGTSVWRSLCTGIKTISSKDVHSRLSSSVSHNLCIILYTQCNVSHT